MSRIDVQKFSNGAPPSGGKLFIGTYLSNEPEVNTITVYTDAALTAGISIISGVDLDQDGYPLINGVRTNLYVGVNYSLQILDRNNAPFFPEAFQETVTEQAATSFTNLDDTPSGYGTLGQVATTNGVDGITWADAGGFDPSADISFTGDCSFDISSSATNSWWAGNVNPSMAQPNASIFVDVGNTRRFDLYSQETFSTNGSSSYCNGTSYNTQSGGSQFVVGVNSLALVIANDGEGTTLNASLGQQTANMSGGTPDDYIATKKYVDDNSGGGTSLYNFDPVAQTTANFTGIAGHFYSVSTDEVSAVVASPEASPVGGDQVFIRSSGQGALNFAPDISAFSGLTMVVGTDVCLTYLSGLNAWQKTSEF